MGDSDADPDAERDQAGLVLQDATINYVNALRAEIKSLRDFKTWATSRIHDWADSHRALVRRVKYLETRSQCPHRHVNTPPPKGNNNNENNAMIRFDSKDCNDDEGKHIEIESVTPSTALAVKGKATIAHHNRFTTPLKLEHRLDHEHSCAPLIIEKQLNDSHFDDDSNANAAKPPKRNAFVNCSHDRDERDEEERMEINPVDTPTDEIGNEHEGERQAQQQQQQQQESSRLKRRSRKSRRRSSMSFGTDSRSTGDTPKPMHPQIATEDDSINASIPTASAKRLKRDIVAELLPPSSDRTAYEAHETPHSNTLRGDRTEFKLYEVPAERTRRHTIDGSMAVKDIEKEKEKENVDPVDGFDKARDISTTPKTPHTNSNVNLGNATSAHNDADDDKEDADEYIEHTPFPSSPSALYPVPPLPEIQSPPSPPSSPVPRSAEQRRVKAEDTLATNARSLSSPKPHKASRSRSLTSEQQASKHGAKSVATTDHHPTTRRRASTTGRPSAFEGFRTAADAVRVVEQLHKDREEKEFKLPELNTRRKDDRKKMQARTCPECEAFINLEAEAQGLNERERQDMLQRCSRHRCRHKGGGAGAGATDAGPRGGRGTRMKETPDDYWDLTFDETTQPPPNWRPSQS